MPDTDFRTGTRATRQTIRFTMVRLRRAVGGSHQIPVESGVRQLPARWWAVQDSNLRHPRCKRGALTTELTARKAAEGGARPSRGRVRIRTRVVPRPGLEPGWIAPYAPQTYAYTNSATWARTISRRRCAARDSTGPPDGPEFLVPRRGFEPLHPCGHRLLKPARLPFRHLGMRSHSVIRRWRGASLSHPNIGPTDPECRSYRDPGPCS